MQTIDTQDSVADIVLDIDVAAGATVRSNVFFSARGIISASVELHVTLLAGGPVNLGLLVLGQNLPPAAESTRLLPMTLALPDTSAIAADYAAVFLLPMFTLYSQLEVHNISGGAVHVQAVMAGSAADFTGAPPAVAAGAATSVQLVAGAADAGTMHLASGTVVALATAAQTALDTLAGAIASGSIKSVLQAGSAAFGKLAANSGVNIGSVDVLSLPSLVLAAGANAIGKLAANAGINIGTVDIGALATWIDTVASADTSAHAYGTSQVVKAPVFVRVARTTTGIVTFGDGTRTGMALSGGDAMPLHCTNLNQITYAFSINAATEKFSLSAGI